MNHGNSITKSRGQEIKYNDINRLCWIWSGHYADIARALCGHKKNQADYFLGI